MQEALSLSQVPSSGLEEKKQKLKEAGDELNAQLKQLHGMRVCGYSAYQLLSEYMKVADDRKEISFDEEFIRTLSREQIELYESVLRRASECRALLRTKPAHHPLKDWGKYSYIPGMQGSIRPALDNYAKSLMLVRRFGEQACEVLQVPFQTKKAFLLSVQKAVSLAKKQGGIPRKRKANPDGPQLWEIEAGSGQSLHD